MCPRCRIEKQNFKECPRNWILGVSWATLPKQISWVLSALNIYKWMGLGELITPVEHQSKSTRWGCQQGYIIGITNSSNKMMFPEAANTKLMQVQQKVIDIDSEQNRWQNSTLPNTIGNTKRLRKGRLPSNLHWLLSIPERKQSNYNRQQIPSKKLQKESIVINTVKSFASIQKTTKHPWFSKNIVRDNILDETSAKSNKVTFLLALLASK